MSEYPLYICLPQDGKKESRFTSWGNDSTYRERSIAASTHPDSAQDRVSVLPFIARGAPASLVIKYTGLSHDAESRSRQWLVKNNKTCGNPKTINLRKQFSLYERTRVKTESPEIVEKIILIGGKLVEKGVIPVETLEWQELHSAVKETKIGELLTGFPEFLIIEGLLQSRKHNLSNIEDKIRHLLDAGRLNDHFANSLKLLKDVISVVHE